MKAKEKGFLGRKADFNFCFYSIRKITMRVSKLIKTNKNSIYIEFRRLETHKTTNNNFD